MERAITTLRGPMSTQGNSDGNHFYPPVKERISQEPPGELAFSEQKTVDQDLTLARKTEDEGIDALGQRQVNGTILYWAWPTPS